MFSVTRLAQFASNPRRRHWQAAKHVLRYLHGSINLSLVYRRTDSNDVCAYSDADWASDIDDRRSNSGTAITIGHSLVIWKTSKQKCVSLSTMEAEYLALSQITKEAVWIATILKELKFLPNFAFPLIIHCDNRSAIDFSKNNVENKRSKHIDIRYHHVRERIISGEIKIVYIPTKENLADVFTKTLSKVAHKNACDFMNCSPVQRFSGGMMREAPKPGLKRRRGSSNKIAKKTWAQLAWLIVPCPVRAPNSGIQDEQRLYSMLGEAAHGVLKEDKKQESSKMKTNEIRAVIKYLCKKGMSPKEIYEDMVDRLRKEAPSYSTDNLALFEANQEEFVNRIITMDETCAHYFTPESKQQSMQWRHSNSPPPKKAKTVPSAGKVMVSVFWDSEGVLHLDFLNKGQTITGNYYANLVKQLREAIKEKRRGKLSRKIVYHQDNALSHRSLQAMAAIYDSGFEILPHAPYSPDLALSDFHLFPHLKKSLSGIHFRSDEEGIDAVT
ncbi:hypothetical protein LAZ67_17000494 [Cordylochernes scorpioides]|uniref:Uncharacterized protein n=1 Tax=Cordylochernes scorpioides TaxID=51811 RepID=A0ABY6LGE0_9ARAC|nr:hypothetical protein LAZ67_17000494 [Cordylochernes scorpioides]